MTRITIAACVLVASGWALTRSANAQPADTESAEVRAVIETTQRLFDAMEARDSTALSAVLHPAAQIIAVGPGGQVDVSPGGRDPWIESVLGTAEVLRERMWTPRVEIDGPLATLWAPYDFYLGDRFSHCGTDAFQFVRDGEAWRLIVVTFTVQMERCEVARETAP